jgi:hypothetical protein
MVEGCREVDKAFDPVDIRFLGPAVVFCEDPATHLV